MEGATLTFRFVEEGGGARGPSPNSQAVEGQVDQSVSATQQAITNAGGVGNFVGQSTKWRQVGPDEVLQPGSKVKLDVGTGTSWVQVPGDNALPVPPVSTTTASSDPLLSTVSKLVQADPNVTAAELAKALGIKLGQAQSLLAQAIGTPPPQLVTPPSAVPDTPPTSPTQPPPVPPIQPPPPPPPVVTPPPVQGQPTPPPVVTPPTPPNTLPPNAGQGVINTINSLAHFAQAGGPMGSAIAGLATATANLPGVAGSIAAAAPALVAAAPYVALAGAALAVPAAGAAVLNEVFANARSQLQGLDPRVASAEAEANVRQILANFRTSARLGDEIAEGVEIRSRRSAALQGIRDVVSEVPLQRFNDAANGFTKTLELINNNLQKSPMAQAAVQSATNSWLDIVLLGMGGIGTATLGAELLGKIMNKGDEIKNDNPLTFWQNKPLPKLPAPFTEAGEAVRPKVNPASFGPGLGISF